MDLILTIVLFTAGLILLIKGADALVSGASSIASLFKINPMVIGLTIVAFGTSAPELVVSLTSAVGGNTSLALGNIIGSNIANILLILGIAATLYPLKVHKNTVWKEIPMSLLGVIVLFVLALSSIIDSGQLFSISMMDSGIIGSITRSSGLILLFFFIIFIYYTFGIAKVSADTEPEIIKRSAKISAILVVLGLIGLGIGSKLLVDNGIVIAKLFGVSDTFIGLTLVAVGTSLPELITTAVAALKKNVDIAVGNVIGSNIFNVFLVLGITAFARPIPLNENNLIDIFVLLGATIFLFGSLFVLRRHTLGKVEGMGMLIFYICYVGYLVVRG